MYLHESRPAVYLKKREEICIYTMYSRQAAIDWRREA